MTPTLSGKECFYLPEQGDDQIILRKAFSNFLTSGYKEGWIAFVVEENIRNICEYHEFAILEPLVTEEQMNFGNFKIHRLLDYYFDRKDRKVNYELPLDGANRPLLVIHPKTDYLERLDGIPNVPVMIVVPFMEKEISDWVQKNNAKLLTI